MAGETAAEVYGFDLDLLEPIADRIGPDIDDVVTPRTPPPGGVSGGRLRPRQGERPRVGSPARGPDRRSGLSRVSGDLTGRVALVTGAGAGVGVGIVEVLAARGAKVAVNDLRPERAAATAAAVGAMAVPFDVTDLDAVRAGVAAVEADLGAVDVLVNNAGIPADGFVPAPFLASGPDDWHRFVSLNLYGVMNLALVTLPGMCERGWGRVVTISSDAGRVGSPMGLSLYGASKAGALGWMRHVAHEVGPSGVTVNALSLGVMAGGGMPPEFALGQPIPRLGEPEDAGHAVAFLASDEAAWITGQVVAVNGGGVT